MTARPPTTFESFYLASRDRCFRAVAVTVADNDEADDLVAGAYLRALAHWLRFALIPHPPRGLSGRHLTCTATGGAALVEADGCSNGAKRPHVDDTDPRILDAVRTLPMRQRQAVTPASHPRTLRRTGRDDPRHRAGNRLPHLRRGLLTLQRTLEPPPTTTTIAAAAATCGITTINQETQP